MREIFVTRHSGAVDWAIRHNYISPDKEVEVISHFGDENINSLKEGDVVRGTLPINIVQELNAKGVHYWHLSLNIPADARGRELTADDMDNFGCSLIQYSVSLV